MDGALDFLLRTLEAGEPACWVSVAALRGSAPREPGATMMVARSSFAGTIGGGRLEALALEHARDCLAACPAVEARPYPLGASAGQCCGGVVQLAYEWLRPADLPAIRAVFERQRAGEAWLRLLPLGAGGHSFLADRPEDLPAHLAASGTALLAGDADAAACLVQDAAGRPALLFAARPAPFHLALFGAGHVGRALVEVLGRLPLRVSWFDSRADAFPAALPANVHAVLTDTPEADALAQPVGTAFLIMTHSHALDFELVRALLAQDNGGFCGLIGSASKRLSFVRRLRARGLSEARIARLSCPVGIPGIAGKAPELIALSVAAQLMQLREARRASRQDSHAA